MIIEVRDTGIGISADYLPHIFEMFTQASDSYDRRSQFGLGVGLALSKRLVELHGGTLSAESKGPGEGSSFRIQLPTVA